MSNTEQTGRTVGAVATTFAVIEALESKEPCGVTALAESMDLLKSTVHNTCGHS